MSESKGSKLKIRLPTILRSPFSRRKKSENKDAIPTADVPYDGSGSTSMHASESSAATDATSKPQPEVDISRSATRPNASMELNAIHDDHHVVSDGTLDVEERPLSPSPSQTTRSMRHSMSKGTSSENFRVSLTVDTIKQQLNDGLQMLAEFKKSIRASSDVQRYNEAVGNFESAARDLTMLKSKLSIRKLSGNRPSYVLPPPDLKIDIEESPFSVTIPEMEETGKASLEPVKENEVQNNHQV